MRLTATMSERSEVVPDSDPSKLGRSLRRVVLPALAFLGGFLWDAVTLGRQIKSWDLAILSVYYVAAAAILVLIGRRVEFRGSSKLNLALQFLFGGMFSALVVLYFLSSGSLLGFVVVLGLAGMLVTNEFLGERYDRLSFSWAVFGVCGVMLLNFVLPHLMHSIHPAWFYLSLLVAVLLVIGLRLISRDRVAVVWPTLLVAGLLAILHVFNFIPPVPVSSRAMLVGSEVVRENGDYIVRGRASRAVWLVRPTTLVRESGDAVYCFTSIFLPPGIETKITHRWMRLNPGTGEWVTTDTLPFSIVGGRRGGYRGYTYKRKISNGEWKVVAESDGGRVIAETRFRVAERGADAVRRFERRF